MDKAVTTMLLLERVNLDVQHEARKAIWARRCRIDVELVLTLYKACPAELKLSFACIGAVPLLPPSEFHAIFRDAYHRRMSAEERRDLATTLDTFFFRNPKEVPRYRNIILEFLRSRQQEPCLIGITLAARQDDLGQPDLDFVRRKLSVRYTQHRHNAALFFYKLLKRHRRLPARVRTYITSDYVIGKLRHLRREDPDPYVQASALQTLQAYAKIPRPRRTRRSRATRP